jgi:transcriptional regulator with XRE-family HTH domain
MPEKATHKPIGVRIRELREKKSWSLSEAAEHAGISRSYLHQLEQGKSEPTQEKIQQLAAAFGALPSELLGESPASESVPESLRQFAEKEKLGSAEVQMLAQIEYRGQRPNTPEEWRVIYNVIKAMLESK